VCILSIYQLSILGSGSVRRISRRVPFRAGIRVKAFIAARIKHGRDSGETKMAEKENTQNSTEHAEGEVSKASWYYEIQGKQQGPVDETSLKLLLKNGAISPTTLVWSKTLGGNWKAFQDTSLFDGPPQLPVKPSTLPENSVLIRRIADYERISGFVWIALGIIQIILLYTAIAGVWNIIAGISRFRIVKRIKERDSTIPAEYESLSGLILIGIINLLLGGIIGLVFVAFDFFIRDKILTNSHLFDNVRPREFRSGDIPSKQGSRA
jgi:hypothetical protein